ncbi:Carbohydrate sulfotransferase 10 [Chionoecetes opilio]|uniref:Carbohydrate sulfotransferase n=1 Tax=Chionoecetes opilio TaxID=41210 RepID=A0A8J5CVZ8_CHIOP|nr:Carbohydrate sulfotransferase 10 [Chionoecetes opilio]
MLLETDNNSIYTKPAPLSTLDGDLQRIQQRMEGRMDKIKQVCSNENITKKSFTPQAIASARYMTEVLEDHRLLMCVVHKAGSSTWNTILAHHYNKFEELIQGDNMYKMISKLRPPREEYDRVIHSPSLFKVFMARNPFERVLSGFRNRIVTPAKMSAQAKKYVPHVLLYNRGIR